ncbi:hypothetical protein BOX15_Mlig019917g1 [Macrostomum lignano]|uniref:KASH domain-containing protein n=1 Tax=Macrostomum lignano TaxID=282301 RepID=A0A267F3F2_9PLAT|nr:hypothetical protein BOX15_Mlig019917g1 [Macrostomum lignano]
MPVTCTHRRQQHSTSNSKRRNSLKTAPPPSNSSKIIIVRDEFAPAPNKRRRFDANQAVTEEELRNLLQQQQQQQKQQRHNHSPSPDNCQQPLWDLLKPSYTLLMNDSGIMEKCQSMENQSETGNDDAHTLLEFYSMWKEHNDWLRQLQLRLQRPAASKAERYLMHLDAESDHRAHLSAQKKVSHYASALCLANPRVADDVSAKMRSMQEAWLAVDAALELWPGNGGSLLVDLECDLQEARDWLDTANENRIKVPPDVTVLTSEQKTELLRSVQAREEEIQSRLKALDAVVKVLNRLSDDCEPDDRVAKLMSDAELLRSQFFELLLQLMEAKILLDDEFQQFGRSLRGSVSEAAAAAASVAVPSSSWGAESGFVSELSPTGGGRGAAGLNRTLTEGVHATTDSYDVLPFSEDEYEKISNQSSEPIFSLDDLEQRQQAGGRKLPRSADQPSAHRRRRVRDRTAGEQQSRCYYRIMTPADSDDCGQPPDAASDAAAVAVASSSMTTTGTSATPAGQSGGDRQAVEDDSSSSGSKCGISGQKRRFTRSFSPLAVVTRELYVDASALLLGGGSQQQQQQPIPRAASLGAIGGSSSGALSIVMAMETAESETGLAVELLDAGFTSTDSTDGSLADESSIGHSSSPPSPSPAPAPTPTEPMPPPAMSASATATVSYRQSQRGGGGGRSSRRRRSREALLARQSEQRHRLMDARRLACKAERYFTRSAGQLCASAVGFLSQEDQSGQDEAEEEAVATNGPEDLDQLWDHYQPQPYAVGVDEAAEERLDDSHLQWEADQQQFESGQDQRQPAEHPDTERELADTVFRQVRLPVRI